jgi:nicotinamide-nucleotide amidase
MQAEIITIGDEILIGHTIDTNSAWIGQRLNELGVEVVQIRSISDSRSDIMEALNHLHPHTRLVLITGGLGPTKDDLTKKTLADYFQKPLVFNEAVFENIENIFRQIGRNLSQLNRDQALVPEGCEVLMNQMGTAPGMRIKQGDIFFISMPGVPYEMKYIMSNHVLPWIKQELITSNILHKTLLTQGIPESELAQIIQDLEEALPPEIKLAYLPSPGIVKLRLTARGQDRQLLEGLLIKEAQKFKQRLGSAIFSEDSGTLQEVIGEMLVAQKAYVGTAESCTGGYISSMITQIPGSSRYYKGSVIAYDNQVKTGLLKVSDSTLTNHGAVSEPVVTQMAEGLRDLLGVDYAIATSGIAGPDGGTEEKPVGTVWIAIASPGGTVSKKFQFGSNRERNIKRSTLMALDMLRKALMNNSA